MRLDRASMGKRTKKLVVYLDQNFLSEISKIGINKKVRAEFKDVYDLLCRGFVDEKLVVPGSVLHDIESSLASHLKDGISKRLHHMGQVRLRRPEEIRDRQAFEAFDGHLGLSTRDLLRPEVAFEDHPDQKVEPYCVSVDAHMENLDLRSGRHAKSRRLEALRQRLIQTRTTYQQQLEIEREAQRDSFIKDYCTWCRAITPERSQQLAAFTESDAFADIPLLKVEAHLYASILTRKPSRPIKPSDSTDIAALSAYAPYSDVVCTDAFMADQMQVFVTEYDFKLFHAKTNRLQELKVFLESHLTHTRPIRRPSITVFVVPPKEHREESFRFFRQMGAALKSMGTLEYGEVYAFDDGAMPQYELPQFPGKPVPFYGLQDVDVIPLPPGATEEDVLRMCRERCRSEHFVLVDEYREIGKHFMMGASMRAEAQQTATEGYRIFKATV